MSNDPIHASATTIGTTYYSPRGTAFLRVEDAPTGAPRFKNVETGSVFTPEPRFAFYATAEAALEARDATTGATPPLNAAPLQEASQGAPQGALFSEFDAIPEPTPATTATSAKPKRGRKRADAAAVGTVAVGDDGAPETPTRTRRARKTEAATEASISNASTRQSTAPQPTVPQRAAAQPATAPSIPYVSTVEGALGTHNGVAFTLGPKTLIIGPNDAGKDTLTRLVTLPLDASVDDAQGRGVVRTTSIIGDLVPHGAERIRVDAQIIFTGADGDVQEDAASYALTPGKAADHSAPRHVLPRFPLRMAVEELTGTPARARAWLLQHVAPHQTNDEIADALPEGALAAWDRLVDPKRDGLANLREIPKLAKARARDSKVAADTATASIQALRATLDGGTAPTEADVLTTRKRLEAAQDAQRKAEVAETAARARVAEAKREAQEGHGAVDAAYAALPAGVLAAGSPRDALETVERGLAGLQAKLETTEAAQTDAAQTLHAAIAAQTVADAALAAARSKAGVVQADGDAIVGILDRRVARGRPWTCPVCPSDTEHPVATAQEKSAHVRGVLDARNAAVREARDALAARQREVKAAQTAADSATGAVEILRERIDRARNAVEVVKNKIAADAARAGSVEGDDPVRMAEGAHQVADAGVVMATAGADEAQEDYDTILQRKGAAAQLAALRDQRDAAEAAQGEYKALEEGARKLLGRLVADAADGFAARVQQYLPPADRFFVDADDPALPFGFMREGPDGKRYRATVLGGAAWDRMLVAIAAATVARAEAAGECALNVIAPADRSRKPDVLAASLAAWAQIPAQVIVTTTTFPQWVRPEDADAWTVIQLGPVADDGEDDAGDAASVWPVL